MEKGSKWETYTFRGALVLTITALALVVFVQAAAAFEFPVSRLAVWLGTALWVGLLVWTLTIGVKDVYRSRGNVTAVVVTALILFFIICAVIAPFESRFAFIARPMNALFSLIFFAAALKGITISWKNPILPAASQPEPSS